MRYRLSLTLGTLIILINEILAQKLHNLNHFDSINEVDQFSNCNNCLRFPCKLQDNSKCEMRTRFDEFESDRVYFELSLEVFNTSSWLAIGFNAVQDMVSRNSFK